MITNKNLFKLALCTCVSTFISVSAVGQGTVNDSSGGYQTTQQQPGNNIHNNANDGKSDALVGAAANAAGMALMMSFCTGPDPSKTSCVLAAMAGATIPIMLQGASDSGSTAAASYGGYGGFTTPEYDPTTGLPIPGTGTPVGGLDPNTPVPGPYGTVGGLQNAVNDYNSQLGELGFSADSGAGVVNTPDGPVSFSDANAAAAGGGSAGGSGGGLPPALGARLAALSKKYEKLGDDFRVIKSQTKSGGGGGRSYSGKRFKIGSGKDPFADYLKNLNKNKRGTASVKGYKKVVDGTAIGVGADNIFDMVHRNYQSKRNKSLFFEQTFKPRSK